MIDMTVGHIERLLWSLYSWDVVKDGSKKRSVQTHTSPLERGIAVGVMGVYHDSASAHT